jgi:hypothetical protein
MYLTLYRIDYHVYIIYSLVILSVKNIFIWLQQFNNMQ